MRFDLDAIEDQCRASGSLPSAYLEALAEHLQGEDPYRAITVAGDCGARQLADLLAGCLAHADEMVRWNAVGVLFTRWHDARFAADCYRLAISDPDGLVRMIALSGLGELLPHVADASLRRQMAGLLVEVFEDDQQLLVDRGTAYAAILAAIGVPPLERPPASRMIDLQRDVDPARVADFRKRYL
jgi:HEAT repeat protein